MTGDSAGRLRGYPDRHDRRAARDDGYGTGRPAGDGRAAGIAGGDGEPEASGRHGRPATAAQAGPDQHYATGDLSYGPLDAGTDGRRAGQYPADPFRVPQQYRPDSRAGGYADGGYGARGYADSGGRSGGNGTAGHAAEPWVADDGTSYGRADYGDAAFRDSADAGAPGPADLWHTGGTARCRDADYLTAGDREADGSGTAEYRSAGFGAGDSYGEPSPRGDSRQQSGYGAGRDQYAGHDGGYQQGGYGAGRDQYAGHDGGYQQGGYGASQDQYAGHEGGYQQGYGFGPDEYAGRDEYVGRDGGYQQGGYGTGRGEYAGQDGPYRQGPYEPGSIDPDLRYQPYAPTAGPGSAGARDDRLAGDAAGMGADGYGRWHVAGDDTGNGWHAGQAAAAEGPQPADWGSWSGDPGPGEHREEPPAGQGDDWDGQAGDNQLMARFGRGGGGGKAGRRRHRWFFTVILIIALLIGALVLGVAARVALHWWGQRYGNYTGAGYGTVQVQVRPGDGADQLAPRLVRLGVIESAGPFISAANNTSASQLQPGIYKLHHRMNAALAWKLLLSPEARISTGVTIPEGLRNSQIIERLSSDTKVPLSAFKRALQNPAALGLPAYAHGNPEGYLFPLTYQFTPRESATQILRTMVSEFRQQAASMNLPAEAAKVNLTPGQVIVIASLVQAEAGRLSDFGMIARVIDNRLNRGMRLQFDSTILYALGKYGIRATASELRLRSPYNTYLHTGLPPGAIDSPGNAAIQAALHPPHGNWLYFITVDPRTRLTRFTSSYAQFQRWEQQARTGKG